MIRAEDLAIELGGRTILTGLDLHVEPGGLVCIVGPNGAGKTTLLRALAGEIRPSAGAVMVGGEVLSELASPERALVRAFLAQVDRPDIPYSARTVVGFGTHLSTLDRRTQDATVRRALADLGIEDVADRRVGSLSGGERRRVAIARTLAQDASVLLLDEPTDSLDLGHADEVLALLADLAVSGRTVVVSSHDLNLAARHGERIVMMDRGRIVADGSPSRVLTTDLLGATYRCEVRVTTHPENGYPVVYL